MTKLQPPKYFPIVVCTAVKLLDYNFLLFLVKMFEWPDVCHGAAFKVLMVDEL